MKAGAMMSNFRSYTPDIRICKAFQDIMDGIAADVKSKSPEIPSAVCALVAIEVMYGFLDAASDELNYHRPVEKEEPN
jgi:hypothetical protein